jgi:hypothetical protein
MAGFAACSGGGDEDPLDQDDVASEGGKADAWDYANNPAKVGEPFIYDLTRLPIRGATVTVPIAGDYWATYQDSINKRWDGDEPSPAEKVARAFNLPNFTKYITDNFGIYGHGRKACDATSECESEKDGSECVTPRGVTGAKAGRCIPGWWGICHGWAPYAFSEPAATRAVTKNGVTFYPGDLTALMSLIYSEDLPTKFLSSRCNKKDVGTDNTGRVRDSDSECRDMNPGTLFIVASNFLGLQQRGFVEDRTYDLQVWNQPVQGYDVTNANGGKLKEITKAEAVALLGLGFTFSSLLPETELAANVEKTGSYRATASGEIVFRTDGTEGDVDLFIKKNAAVSSSAFDCSGTSGSAKEECKITVAVGDTISWIVKGYSASKKVTLSVGEAGSTTNYVYNTSAARFFYVEMDMHYITEAGPGRTMPDASQSIRTDHYKMILEADADGRALGGEWVGESRSAHPDFAWWPKGKPGANLGGLTYAMVKALNDEAAGGGSAGRIEEKVVFEGKSIKYGNAMADVRAQSEAFGVPSGVKKAVFTLTGTGGDVDLYVRVGSYPTTSKYTKKSAKAGAATETVTIDNIPASGSSYYVRARIPYSARSATVSATVKATLYY